MGSGNSKQNGKDKSHHRKSGRVNNKAEQNTKTDGTFIMKTVKVTQSENIQTILDERKGMKEYKETYENLIEKYNDKSWKWIPSGFREDYIKAIKIKQKQYASLDEAPSAYFARTIIDKKGLEIFLELEKTITNPYFFWSLVAEEYTQSNFHQSVLLEWLEAFTRYGRTENTTLEQRQKCADNIFETMKKKKANTENYVMRKALKGRDDIIVYRGTSIAKNTYVRIGKKKVNNPNAHQQDGGLGFSYTLSKVSAEFFANTLSVEKDTMQYVGDDVGEIPSFIDKEMINETSKRVVTKHFMKKQNILFYNDFMDESEIVALPDDVDLLRYDLAKKAYKPHPTRERDDNYWFENKDNLGELLAKFGSLEEYKHENIDGWIWKADNKKLKNKKMNDGERKSLDAIKNYVKKESGSHDSLLDSGVFIGLDDTNWVVSI